VIELANYLAHDCQELVGEREEGRERRETSLLPLPGFRQGIHSPLLKTKQPGTTR
jgi:hypothetical protein